MVIQITRKTKLGFGYTSACEQAENGLRVCEVEKPDYTGTIKQMQEKIDSDRTLQSFRSGGTYYNTAWFVKINGKWQKIRWEYPTIFNLTERMPEGNYWVDVVDVELA